MAIDDAGSQFDRRFGFPLPTAIGTGVALLAAGFVHLIATRVFPYLSSNNDEGVYLQQASMLLDGQLVMDAGDLIGAFRPWFFVVDAGTMYPKYEPVTAAVFALGKLSFGSFEASLPVIAFLNVLLVYAIVAAVFDRPTGVVAAVALVGSPLFLITSSVFLPYAPTMAFNLLFAFAYVRSGRRSSLGYAAFAGTAVGIAFFARPYTALLFALPFCVHAIVVLARARGDSVRSHLLRYAVTSVFGLFFVGLALRYNSTVTGDPLVFPYEAFAPRDGIGFGHREILGYDRIYDLPLAIRTNAIVLSEFATRWMVVGPTGTVLALIGLAFGFGRPGTPESDAFSGQSLRFVLAGLVVSIVAGNLAFWGNLNILADPSNPNDGLISLFGPFYHFDLLLPISAFVAVGVLSVARTLGTVTNERFDPTHARAMLLVVLVASAPLVAVTERGVVEPKLDANAAFTEKYERAYRPFETREYDGLVFLPIPYGHWLNHPFQYLRNDPDLNGDTVFAMDRDPTGDFAVVDAYPNRTLYRYTYRGRWVPASRPHVEPAVRELNKYAGRQLTIRTTVGIPDSTTGGTVRLSNGNDATQYEITDEDFDGNLTIAWVLAPNGTRVVGENVRRVGPSEREAVPLSNEEETVLSITFAQPGGASVTYRQQLTAIAEGNQRVRVIWPPETSVCRLVTDCGREGTYLPDGDDDYLPGVHINSTLMVEGERKESGPYSRTLSATAPEGTL